VVQSLIDPPPPPHARPPRPVELTKEIQERAIAIDRDPTTYPIGAASEEDVGGVRYWFRVVEHTTQAATGRHGLFHAVEVWILEDCAPVTLVSTAHAEGIDVSDYQRGADFAKIAASGRVFAYVKATEGASGPNSSQRYFGDHFRGAGGAGLLVGAYHFFRTTSDPRDQIAHFLDVVGPYSATDPGTLPPMIDVEWQHPHPGELGALAPEAFAEAVLVAVEELSSLTGRRPLLYTAPGFWTLLPPSPGIVAATDLFQAQYAPRTSPLGTWPCWMAWQYTNGGTVPGCPGRADCDRFAGDLGALRVWAGIDTPPEAA